MIVGGADLQNIIIKLLGIQQELSVAAIVFGSFLIVTSIIGSYGVYHEMSRFLRVYLISLIILLILQISIGIAGFVAHNRLYDILHYAWNSKYTFDQDVLLQIETLVFIFNIDEMLRI